MTQYQATFLLIAANEPKTLEIVEFLSAQGFDIIQNIGEHELLQWLHNNPVDLVIVDLALLGNRTKSVVENIHIWNDKLPVVILRSHEDDDGSVFKELNDHVDILYKPALNLDQLNHCVRRALNTSALALENIDYRLQLEKANKELKEYIRVLERDQLAGRRIQSKLLPSAPVTHNGFHIDYKIIPSLYLSGDFIDYGFWGNRYFAFYLCDVSGHGAAPAFVTVWLKQIVRRFFYQNELFVSDESFENDTANLLAKLNQEFMRTSLGSHLTSFVGVIDTHTSEMRYVVAGHLPLPVLTVDGKAFYLEGKGKPVGIFANTTWEVQKYSLPQDKPFSLTVFSDGVLEILPPENLIDKENYLLKLMSNNVKDVESVCNELKLSNVEHAPDDIAVLRIDNEMFE